MGEPFKLIDTNCTVYYVDCILRHVGSIYPQETIPDKPSTCSLPLLSPNCFIRVCLTADTILCIGLTV